MNYKLLNIGDTFTTKRKMLDFVGFPKATGDTQKKQLTEFERYVKWEIKEITIKNKPKKQITILEIYSEPKEYIERRGGKRDGAGIKSKYNFPYMFQSMCYTVADERIKTKIGCQAFTKNELMVRFGLIRYSNKDYFKDLRYNKNSSGEERILISYKKDLRKKFTNCLYSAILYFRNTGGIDIQKTYFKWGKDFADRKVVTEQEHDDIENLKQNLFKAFLTMDDNELILKKLCFKKINENPNYSIIMSDLEYSPDLRDKFYTFCNDVTLTDYGFNHCPCYNFVLNKQREDLIENKNFYGYISIQSDIKDSFREWDMNENMKKRKNNVLIYNCDVIKNEHNILFNANDF